MLRSNAILSAGSRDSGSSPQAWNVFIMQPPTPWKPSELRRIMGGMLGAGGGVKICECVCFFSKHVPLYNHHAFKRIRIYTHMHTHTSTGAVHKGAKHSFVTYKRTMNKMNGGVKIHEVWRAVPRQVLQHLNHFHTLKKFFKTLR